MKKTEALEILGEPAFKGSSFTAQEYADAWGDDWEFIFMQEMHTAALCSGHILPLVLKF